MISKYIYEEKKPTIKKTQRQHQTRINKMTFTIHPCVCYKTLDEGRSQ